MGIVEAEAQTRNHRESDAQDEVRRNRRELLRRVHR
jgi:hypothetical protein